MLAMCTQILLCLKMLERKRGLLGLAVPIVGKIATIAIEALGSHLQKKRRRAMAKALERLESKQFLNKNQLYKLDHDFLMFGDYEIQTTDGDDQIARKFEQ